MEAANLLKNTNWVNEREEWVLKQHKTFCRKCLPAPDNTAEAVWGPWAEKRLVDREKMTQHQATCYKDTPRFRHLCKLMAEQYFSMKSWILKNTVAVMFEEKLLKGKLTMAELHILHDDNFGSKTIAKYAKHAYFTLLSRDEFANACGYEDIRQVQLDYMMNLVVQWTDQLITVPGFV